MSDPRLSRRHFLLGAVAATALPLLGRIGQAQAAALAKLSPASPQAKALGYVEDAAKAPPARKPGSVCANCQFFTAATGACVLFPGSSVSPKAWCSAWAKKA
jgi:High potential iron-sulfur protein